MPSGCGNVTKKLRLELVDALVEDFVNQKANADKPIMSPGHKSNHHNSRLHGNSKGQCENRKKKQR